MAKFLQETIGEMAVNPSSDLRDAAKNFEDLFRKVRPEQSYILMSKARRSFVHGSAVSRVNPFLPKIYCASHGNFMMN